MNPGKKLTTEEKLRLLSLSGEKSLRELAEEFGLHHSSIDEIINESKEILAEHWNEKAKRVGRPKKKVNEEEIKIKEMEKELHEQKVETAKAKMSLDYYKLVMNWNGIEEPHSATKHLKKKKKRT